MGNPLRAMARAQINAALNGLEGVVVTRDMIKDSGLGKLVSRVASKVAQEDVVKRFASTADLSRCDMLYLGLWGFDLHH